MNKISEIKKELTTSQLYKYQKQYEEYSSYLSEEFFQNAFQTFLEKNSQELGDNWETSFSLYLQNAVNKQLVKYVREEDIDLEIKLIDQYMPILNRILVKMRLGDKALDKEEVLMKAIETYDGGSLFSLHLVNVVRKKLKGEEIVPQVGVVETKIVENSNESLIPPVVEEPVEEDKLSFEECVQRYILDNDLTSHVFLSYIEGLVVWFQLIEKIEDENLKRYIYLKFGYHNGIFFTDKDIAKLLQVTEGDVTNMYLASLNLLKLTINKFIDWVLSVQDSPVFSGKNYEEVRKKCLNLQD